MKKFLTALILLAAVGIQSAMAVTFDEAMSQNKPVAVLIYAPWADGQDTMLQAFNNMGARYGEAYNFASVNIATEEAESFNERCYIYPNLPYVLLFRSGGKVSRFLKKDCVLDEACFAERLDMFNN